MYICVYMFICMNALCTCSFLVVIRVVIPFVSCSANPSSTSFSLLAYLTPSSLFSLPTNFSLLSFFSFSFSLLLPPSHSSYPLHHLVIPLISSPVHYLPSQSLPIPAIPHWVTPLPCHTMHIPHSTMEKCATDRHRGNMSSVYKWLMIEFFEWHDLQC